MTICSDLIPNIVSFVDYKYLRQLSKASPIFDEVICKTGIRIVYDGRRYSILQEGDVVIHTGIELVIINDLRYRFIEDSIEDSYDLLLRQIRKSNVIPANICDCYISIFEMIVICCTDDGAYVIIKVDEIKATRNSFIAIIGFDEYSINRDCIQENTVCKHISNVIDYIDLESRYIICIRNGIISYSKFRIVFDDGKWM